MKKYKSSTGKELYVPIDDLFANCDSIINSGICPSRNHLNVCCSDCIMDNDNRKALYEYQRYGDLTNIDTVFGELPDFGKEKLSSTQSKMIFPHLKMHVLRQRLRKGFISKSC